MRKAEEEAQERMDAADAKRLADAIEEEREFARLSREEALKAARIARITAVDQRNRRMLLNAKKNLDAGAVLYSDTHARTL
jgi:hypothetical protein